MVNSLDEALRILKNAVRKKENISVGLVGNCGDIIPELAERGVVPDILTDQTSAHDPLNGYVPSGMTLEAALELRQRDPKAYRRALARHHGAPRRRHAQAAEDGLGHLRLRQQHSHLCLRARREERLRFPGIRAGVHSSAVLRRARAVPLGGALGRSRRHSRHRRSRAGDVPAEPHSQPLDRPGAQADQVPGTAVAHLLARLRRARAVRPGA